MAPDVMTVNAHPSTITESGIGRCPCPMSRSNPSTPTKLARPASSTERASLTLAYRHICPYSPNR